MMFANAMLPVPAKVTSISLNVTVCPLGIVGLTTLPVSTVGIASCILRNTILPVSLTVKSPSVSTYTYWPTVPGIPGSKSIIRLLGDIINKSGPGPDSTTTPTILAIDVALALAKPSEVATTTSLFSKP